MSADGAATRLDRWLWAARFFKTRAQAKLAIEGGKVQYDGNRAKPSKVVAVGAELRVRRGLDEMVVIVTGLSERRGSATDAQRLYEETPDSIRNRENTKAHRRALGLGFAPPSGRPTKRGRRQIARLKQFGR